MYNAFRNTAIGLDTLKMYQEQGRSLEDIIADTNKQLDDIESKEAAHQAHMKALYKSILEQKYYVFTFNSNSKMYLEVLKIDSSKDAWAKTVHVSIDMANRYATTHSEKGTGTKIETFDNERINRLCIVENDGVFSKYVKPISKEIFDEKVQDAEIILELTKKLKGDGN